MNQSVGEKVEEKQSLVRPKSSSSSQSPHNNIAKALVPLASLVLILIISQYTDKLMQQSFEISNIIPKPVYGAYIFEIKLNEIPKTFQFFDVTLYFTCQSPPAKPFNVKIFYNDTVSNKINNVTRQVTLLRPNAFSTVVLKKSFLLSKLKDNIYFKFQNIPEEVTGFLVQIRGISLSTYYFSYIHLAFASLALIIVGFSVFRIYMRKSYNTNNLLNVSFYLSCIGYIFPYDMINTSSINFISPILTSLFPGFFCYLSFQILEDAGPLVPLPVIFKENTTLRLSFCLSIFCCLCGMFRSSDYKYIFFLLYFVAFLVYTYYIRALYKVMQCQQKRIEESYAMWLRSLFLVISLLFLGKDIQFYINIPYQICKSIEILSTWTVIGTTIGTLNILSASDSNSFQSISVSKDDGKFLSSLFESPEPNNNNRYVQNDEFTTTQLVDGIFNKEYPEESFGGQVYYNPQGYDQYPPVYEDQYMNQGGYGQPMYDPGMYQNENIQNQMYLQSFY